MRARIDIHSINKDDFYVQKGEIGTLIAPRKGKHSWTDDELHLRSLIVDESGKIISSGFPKFFNYGEKKDVDRLLEEAVADGRVEFLEKRDGSLLIGDHINGQVHWRTRGSLNLGEFEPHVKATLAGYERMVEFLEDAKYPWVKECSFLFEYTGPENRIILPYERAEIHLLGIVDKNSLKIIYSGEKMEQVCEEAGVCQPKTYELKNNWNEIKREVSGWKGQEGVVARFIGDDGVARLVKIKSLEYLMRHALRYRLNSKRAIQFALMLGAEKVDDLKPLFDELSLDYEAMEYIRPAVEEFLVAKKMAEKKFVEFEEAVNIWRAESMGDKKTFVARVTEAVKPGGQFEGKPWFSRAMLLHNGKTEEARVNLLGEIVNEPASVVKNWLSLGRAGVMQELAGFVKEEAVGPGEERVEREVGAKRRTL